jgi:exonuclease III
VNTAGKNNDIILVQEVNIKDPRYATTHPDFLLLLPPHGDRKTNRTATYVSRHNPHLRVTPRPDICADPDIQVLEVGTPLIPPIYIINIYNEKYHPRTPYTIPRSLAQLVLPQRCIITGDLNAHHTLWNSRVRYPTRADELVTLIEEHGWHLANTPDTPTYHYRKGTGSSVLDLMLATPAVAREVSNWAVDEENPTGSDHEVVLFQICILHPDTDHETTEPHLNWRKTNWDTFLSTLRKLSTNNYPLWSSAHANPTIHQLDNWASLL